MVVLDKALALEGLSLGVKPLLVVLLIAAVVRICSIGRREKSLPPGPATIPVFGNEWQIPKADCHFIFQKWAKQYGGIFSLKRYSGTTIVISDWLQVKNLLDKKSVKYSFRPKSTVADLITSGHHVLMVQYGESWRTLRKLIHNTFTESMCDKEHYKVQEAEATQLLYDFMENPRENMMHPKRFSNSVTMSLVFGTRTKSIHDEYMNKLYHIMEKWSLVLETGATPPLDAFPLLKWLPESWMGRWKSRAGECRDLMGDLYSKVLNRVRSRRANGIRKDSLMDRVLEQQDVNNLSDHQLGFLGGALMEGGSDTSASLILAIVQAMTIYPEVQKRAQAEIDAAVPQGRSPQWSDFAKLPYINMIIKEAHRWRPVLPLGVVHGIMEDDEADGYRLPKGSTIVMNVWALHNDTSRWKDPEHFIPERYADFPALAPAYATAKDGVMRDHLGYGASRRMCPGIHLAERNLFIATAKLLWAFDFSVDKSLVNDTSIETGSSQGFLHCVKEYGLSVQLREDSKRAVIEKELREAQAVFDRYED